MTTKTDINQPTLAEIFLTPCLPAHVSAVLHDAASYVKELNFLLESGSFSVVPSSVRSSILVALHATAQHEVMASTMEHCEVTDIVKAVTLLDQRRACRQLKRKIQKIENDHPHLLQLSSIGEEEPRPSSSSSLGTYNRKRKPRRKVDQFRRKLRAIETDLVNSCDKPSLCPYHAAHEDSAVQEILQSSSGVSGALARKVRQWASKTLTKDALEYILLTVTNKKPWEQLADLVHFRPSDFVLPYFLANVHGESLPETCFVAQLRAFLNDCDNKTAAQTTSRFQALAEEFPQVYLAYRFLRTQSSLKQADVYENLAAHVPLEIVLWNMEEFHQQSRQCQVIVRGRLRREVSAGDSSSSFYSHKVNTYGKLMERILTFRRMGLAELADDILPLAANRLEELKAYWKERVGDQKVAVLGDASASMQVAIESATIFASLVSVCLQGELNFYNSRVVPSPHKRPQNVYEALKVCTQVRASGCTSPASAMHHYLTVGNATKTHVDLFVHVTDEGENTPFAGHSHASSFQEYKDTVNPNAELVIVCVGKGYRPFRADLDAQQIAYKVVTIDEFRPDLAKFDALLGQLVSSVARRPLEHEKASPAPSSETGDFVLV